MNELILKELKMIRCLLEGIYLDSSEHKKNKVEINNIEERVDDELTEIELEQTKRNTDVSEWEDPRLQDRIVSKEPKVI